MMMKSEEAAKLASHFKPNWVTRYPNKILRERVCDKESEKWMRIKFHEKKNFLEETLRL